MSDTGPAGTPSLEGMMRLADQLGLPRDAYTVLHRAGREIETLRASRSELEGEVARLREALERERERWQIEAAAADRAYLAGLGVSEWEAFLTDDEVARLAALSTEGEHG